MTQQGIEELNGKNNIYSFLSENGTYYYMGVINDKNRDNINDFIKSNHIDKDYEVGFIRSIYYEVR